MYPTLNVNLPYLPTSKRRRKPNLKNVTYSFCKMSNDKKILKLIYKIRYIYISGIISFALPTPLTTPNVTPPRRSSTVTAPQCMLWVPSHSGE